MTNLFEDRPDLLENTLRVAELCEDDVLPQRTRMPKLFPDSNEALRNIVHTEAAFRYPEVKPTLHKRIVKELDRICRLQYADHFLIMWDACRWAREHDIQFSGRGSVVDRTRGIVREIGKAMELPPETVSFLCKRIHGGVPADQLEAALEKRPELRNSTIPKERFQWIFKLAERLMDVPRGMRSHSSGVVISDEPITDTVPVMWSGADAVKIIQWDKRSAKQYSVIPTASSYFRSRLTSYSRSLQATQVEKRSRCGRQSTRSVTSVSPSPTKSK